MTTVSSSLREAVLRKAAESRRTQEEFFEVHADRILACARDLSEVFAGGGRLFVMGNGGSACDAEHVAVEFMHPVLAKRPALPAVSLSVGSAMLTAVGNDSDFSMAFAEQLALLAKPGDAALGISTSGLSSGVNRALATARAMNLKTVGFAGRDGGKMTALCDHAFVVPSFSIHRIQETHGILLHILWDLIHVTRGQEDLL